MAEYVLDDAPPPPELRQALALRDWGVDVLSAPAWIMATATPALNTYNALSAFKSAGAQGQAARWGQENPETLEFVSGILRDRMDRRR